MPIGLLKLRKKLDMKAEVYGMRIRLNIRKSTDNIEFIVGGFSYVDLRLKWI
jgi:hypothetical protein